MPGRLYAGCIVLSKIIGPYVGEKIYLCKLNELFFKER
ncbi:Uncharacterised protein [Rikenella microfusus]|uniref:Uncharacterized protein n=1 Tax=Rikenella microfusus TaxID=28139 RepID=A0A379MVV9_9BACT|nr:Uncharacterised protein [Rikenella microfusus]